MVNNLLAHFYFSNFWVFHSTLVYTACLFPPEMLQQTRFAAENGQAPSTQPPPSFTQPPPSVTPEPERKSGKSPMGGFGLAEASSDDMKKKKVMDKDAGELQNDLFRFSNKVTIPHSGHSNLTPNLSKRQNFVNYIQRKEKLRQRIQQEWKRFIKWRTQKRKKKRLKRRIMRTLNKRLKNQFGRIGLSGKRTKEEMKVKFRIKIFSG